MSKLIGTNPNQVPSNADLGTAAFMDKREFLLSKGSSLSTIDAVIPKTAVDVFVYDTSKDSDGGVWRKRTQHTSWYNERLNTTTRGSRREFPAVAVIVAESDKITIYDGDDPSLPMWMTFDSASLYMIYGPCSLSSVIALNGILCYGDPGSAAGTYVINFISEVANRYGSSGKDTFTKFISDRNSQGWTNIFLSPGIINWYTNDVAMTVLPNAPIDSATGLPVPTIAVATNGGVSVIKDDGTVVDSTSSIISWVMFDEDTLYFEYLNSAKYQLISTLADGFSGYEFAKSIVTTPIYAHGSVSNNANAVLNKNTISVGSSSSAALGAGLGIYHKGRDDINYGSLASLDSGYRQAVITSDYNTGWMNGDIKLATLSDTEAGDNSTEFITNGDFSNGTTGWSVTTGASITESGGVATVTSSGSNTWSGAYQGITGLEVGKTYIATADIITSSNWGSFSFSNGGGSAFKYGSYSSWNGGSSFPLKARAYFVATTTSVVLNIDSLNTTAATVTQIDNITVREAVVDRSVNAKPLQVFGTVTKNPVANGADLVAYSGFSTTGAKTNYLHQTYNSGLDFDTSFCFMGWVKVNAAVGSQDQHFFDLSPTNGSGRVNIFWNHNSSAFQIAPGNGGTNVVTQALGYGEWHHLVCLANTSSTQIYLNGTLSNTGSGGFNHSLASDAYLTIGARFAPYSNSAYGLNGSLALIRLSKTTPSPEQIKKIYEDEKVLFQENAKATLYGSSNAVTALAYDDNTELLHVGTSDGRSDFQGLRRVNNTTRAVSTAISAVDGFIVEE